MLEQYIRRMYDFESNGVWYLSSNSTLPLRGKEAWDCTGWGDRPKIGKSVFGDLDLSLCYYPSPSPSPSLSLPP